jgi:hypothetical protein
MLGSAEGAGLVPVPTTPNRVDGFKNSAVQKLEAIEAAEGFVLDPEGLKFAKLRMHVGFAARAHGIARKGHRKDRAWMVTLTYRGDASAWKPTHLTRAVDLWRKWCNRKGISCRYVWVAELQQRGVIHYHLIAWMPSHLSMPMWDKAGWWPHGMTERAIARRPIPYLLSYIKKEQSDERGTYPRGSRRYGVGGLDRSLRRARAWLNRPGFVQGMGSIDDKWRRAAGGGWVDCSTGEVWPSEFECRFDTRTQTRYVIRWHKHPRLIDASGPFSWIDQPQREAAQACASSVDRLVTLH